MTHRPLGSRVRINPHVSLPLRARDTLRALAEHYGFRVRVEPKGEAVAVQTADEDSPEDFVEIATCRPHQAVDAFVRHIATLI